MAIQRLLLLSTLLLLALFTISANARPCKTILFISSSSSSSSFSSNQNPNLLFSNPRFITFSYTTSLRQPITFSAEGASLNRPFLISTPQKSTHNPVNFDSSVGNSIRDRTLDILSIVSALLFGVGCGALTAAFMYLVWYICSPRTFDFGANESDEEDDDDDEVTAAKRKLGYVAVAVDAPAPVKQVE